MTLDKACELIKVQISFGSGYNRNAAKLILAEVQKEHSQVYVDQLINVNLEEAFGFKPGSIFSY
ncbi:MAG: hypothetical protein LJE85_00735 [Gammaproteobacteria bacterium]|nr:hypothetical protein [Gammaproteobacteria bacterium]